MMKNKSPRTFKNKKNRGIEDIKLPEVDIQMLLYYSFDNNYFSDEFGEILYDIHRVLSPAQINFFMKNGGPSCLMRDVTNSFLIEVVYI